MRANINCFKTANNQLNRFLVRMPGTVLLAAMIHVLLMGTVSQADSGQLNAIVTPKASESLLLDGVEVDGRLVVVGERGHVLLSDDKGDSWRQAALVPTRATLTAVDFNNSEFGIAVGHDAVILRSIDGGESWKLMFSAPEYQQPFLDVLVVDQKNAFVVGAYGFFMATTDGGETWNELRVNEEDDWHLNQISKAANGKLYIAAEQGTIYRSDDNGKTWMTLPSPYPGSFYGVLPLADDSILAYGLRGHLFSSSDAGETWREVETHARSLLTNALALNGQGVVFVGNAGTILLGQGDPLIVSAVEQKNRRDLVAVLQLDNETVLTIGSEGLEKVRLH